MRSSTSESRILLIQLIALVACVPHFGDSLIITSVLAGDKKFRTISFDHKWLKPLTFEKDMPNTEFRRHRTVRPPKFDIDVNIPIKLPLEDEYPQEEYKRPVESNIFFQTGEISEPSYGAAGSKKSDAPTSYGSGASAQKYTYTDAEAAASESQSAQTARIVDFNMRDGLKGLLPVLARSIKFKPQIEVASQAASETPQHSNARADVLRYMPRPAALPAGFGQQQFVQMPAMVQEEAQIQQRNYAPPSPQAKGNYGQANYGQASYEPEFIPGGFVNLQLSGPTGGPKMTYEDYDKERWAQQLSQTTGAMPYPILNYHQLQNFYGGLGTFTNGLAEHRYVETGLLDKFKSGLNHLTSKLHFG